MPWRPLRLRMPFFSQSLAESDPEVFAAVGKELTRQRHEIELIASENIVSRAVLEAAGNGADQQICRRLSGQALLRRLRISSISPRASPSSAPGGCSTAASPTCSRIPAPRPTRRVLALAAAGRHLLGMGLAAGGHLTHGAPANLSGKWFKAVPLQRFAARTSRIDYRRGRRARPRAQAAS